MEGQFNEEAMEGWRFAANATGIADETKGSEDRKHTSGGVFMAVHKQPGSSCGSGRRGDCVDPPRGVYYWCDNRCSEKALRYMQSPSMLIEEGGEARTFNLCQRCYNEQLVQQGKQSMEWREVVERKAHRVRLWKVFGRHQFLRGMWEYLALK